MSVSRLSDTSSACPAPGTEQGKPVLGEASPGRLGLQQARPAPLPQAQLPGPADLGHDSGDGAPSTHEPPECSRVRTACSALDMKLGL